MKQMLLICRIWKLNTDLLNGEDTLDLECEIHVTLNHLQCSEFVIYTTAVFCLHRDMIDGTENLFLVSVWACSVGEELSPPFSDFYWPKTDAKLLTVYRTNERTL